MSYLWAVLPVVVWLLVGASIGGHVFRWRNTRVAWYRLGLIDAMIRAAEVDRLHGLNDLQWRIDAYAAVSYERMVWQIWRPLASFYPDQSFTRPR